MRILRLILLPALIGAPPARWACEAVFFGWSAAAAVPLSLVDLYAAIGAMIGLCLVGLPAAAFARERLTSTASRVVLLAAAGLAGGALMVAGFLFLIGLFSLHLDRYFALAAAGMAPFGAVAGLVVALVWIAINFSLLKQGAVGRDPAPMSGG